MQLEVSALSDPGGREPNEDAFGFWSGGGGCFCAISDGAGGHGGGDVASKLAVRSILETFQNAPICTGPAVSAALNVAHHAIVAEQGASAQNSAMRATAVVLAIDTVQHMAVWGHVGDTRLYCFRDGMVIAQSKDHSVVQRLVDAGYLTPAATRESTQRSRLYAALGHDEAFEMTIVPEPLSIRNGDAFLLCTDGFWEYVEENAMAVALADSGTAADWLRRMEQQVIDLGGSGQDNFSAVAVWCTDATTASGTNG